MPRQDRYSTSRRVRRRLLVYALPAVLVGAALAFFAGYRLASAPRAKGKKAAATGVIVETVARTKALDLLDRAYTARFEDRKEDAAELLRQARSVDPAVPGADMIAAELASDTLNFSDLRKFATRAATQKQYAGQARALLALEKWLTRSADALEALSFADAVRALFDESCNDGPFDPLTRFFYADVLRQTGRLEEGNARALEAFRRLHPWHSATMISVKSALAKDEAGTASEVAAQQGQGTNYSADSAAVALRRALNSQTDATDQVAALGRLLTAKQLDILFLDSAFAGASGAGAFSGQSSFGCLPGDSAPTGGVSHP